MNNFNDFGQNQNVTSEVDRTTAFNIQRKKRRPDSVAWIISALLLFFLNVMSIGRITVVGQLLDDIIFTLPFGWFKYFLYLIFFMVDFAIYFGIKFKAKKRFLAMVFITWIMFCWLISSILFIVAYKTESKDFVISHYWSKDIFTSSINSYWNHWKAHSFFGSETKDFLISSKDSYFTYYAGGGMFGTALAGVSSYLTIYGALLLNIFFLFVNMMWIFTGDPFFLFKPKHKRTGKRLRILSLKSRRDRQIINNAKSKKKGFGIFNVVNVNPESTLEERNVLISSNHPDITIELPSYLRNIESKPYSEVDEQFYNDDYSLPPEMPLDQRVPNNFENNFQNIRGRGYISQPTTYDFNNQQQYQNNQFQNSPIDNYDQHLNNNQNNYYQDMGAFSQNGYNNEDNYPKNNFQENFISGEPKNIISPRRQQIVNTEKTVSNLDLPSSIYGQNVTTEAARKRFDKQTKITPHGVKGETIEFVKSLKKEKLVKDGEYLATETVENDGAIQSTIDDFVTNDLIQKEHLKPVVEDNYISPLEGIARSSIYGNAQYSRHTPTLNNITLNTNNAVEKSVIVNSRYVLPPLDILNEDLSGEAEYEHLNQEALQMELNINKVFNQFGVNAKVVNKSIGPSFTKFEVQPGPGTKVNSIINLENDLKLALASNNVRLEAPIQGKSAVGIEIPNSHSIIVPLRSVIEKPPIKKIGSKLLFAIGKTATGELLFGELDKAPHLLVAGSTGSGKSVMINGIISSIILRAKPHEVKLLLIDPKKVELSTYSSIPHLLAPVISDMSLANSALKKVINEMDRRYALMQKAGVRNIETYNNNMNDQAKKFPYYVVIIDELADLMSTQNKKDVEESIKRITQMARAAGIHLIVATQRPSTDVITGVIKSNIPSRISFAVASSIDSRTILDSVGAEKLIGKGDLLYLPPLTSITTRAQGCYISDEEIDRLVKYCANQQQQDFDEEFLKMEDEYNDNFNNVGGQKDPMFEEIKAYVISVQKASTSLIQRKFSIGYNRAAKIIDELEAYGVIGPQNGAKPRDVYIKNEGFYQ
ncbi:DNA translocase [Spiroplasma helicoides]|uniref:DNA translocase n=1 Tax=Spiroplasma helicoides TaxID=216938 RepID=A0A1B3SJS1_9MOLU|nr:DNA translocase FtsK [Spiroplasma helicoides]AOG60170.1 DNA translocase [Spiroplasma helicoides]